MSKPIIISNPYTFSANEMTNLFWGYIVRRFWYITLIFTGIVLFNIVVNIIGNPFPLNLIFPVMFTLAFLYARFRFRSALKKKRVEISTVMSIFEDHIVFEDDQNKQLTIQRSNIAGLSIQRIGYVIRLKDRRLVYVAANCFKSSADKDYFEKMGKS